MTLSDPAWQGASQAEGLSGILHGGAAGTAQRWTLPELDGPVIRRPDPEPEEEPEAEEPPEPAIKPPTAEELAAIESAAYEEGFQKGLDDGRNAGRLQMEDELRVAREDISVEAAHLRETLDHLAQPLRDLDESLQHSLLQLAVEVAEKMVGRQLELEPGWIEGIVRDAVDALAGQDRQLRVYLHPRDAELMAAHGGDAAPRPWRILPDAHLSRGGCRVVTETGEADATLQTRMAGVSRAVMGTEE